MMMRILATVLIFISIIKTEASADLIKETREKIAQINISLLRNIEPDKSSVSELEKQLSELKNKIILTNAIIDSTERKNKAEQLIKSFKAFQKFLRSKQKVDTLKKVFRVVNNEFNSLFGNYLLNELINSTKKKIIIFSTSMSCECTLEMCYKQEAEIQKIQKENSDLFDYAVVDCFTNFNLQSKYEIGFIPVALVLDENGKEVKRFVREENLQSELSKYLTR
jgi:hypothetical protein